MHFRVSNSRYKSKQLPGRGGDPLSSTSLRYSTKQNAPELSINGFCSSGRYKDAPRAEGKGVKGGFPKNPFYTFALQREDLPPPPNLYAEATFVSFGK